MASIEIVNDGVFDNEETGNEYQDSKFFTHYDEDTCVICTLHSKVITSSPDTLSINDIRQVIQLFKMNDVPVNINPYEIGKFSWSKIGSSLIINKSEMDIDRVASFTLDNDNILVYLMDSKLYGVSGSSIKMYVYNITNDTYTLTDYSDALFDNGNFLTTDNCAENLVFFKDNKLYFYESIINPSGSEIHEKVVFKKNTVLNITIPADHWIIPHYAAYCKDHFVVALGKISANRYEIREVRVFKKTNEIYTEINNFPVNPIFKSIRRTSAGIIINPSGNTIVMIHIAPFYNKEMNMTFPRYYITIYRLDMTTNKWAFFKELYGSYLDPNYLEARDDIDPKIVYNRKFKAELTAEYRNLYIDEREENNYVSMWCPYIRHNGEIVIIKPGFENITSFVNIDSLR